MSSSDSFNSAGTNIGVRAKARPTQIIIACLVVLAFVVVLAVILINPFKSGSPSADLTGTVKETYGEVSIKQAGQSDFSTASIGQVLQLHGQLQTASSSTARLDLSSGTIIRVAPSSLFTLEANKKTSNGLVTTLTLTLGQVFIILKGGSLDISVPSGVASVRGSFMSALIYPTSNKIFVECLEGHCSATNHAGNLDLTDGQKGILIYAGEGLNQVPQMMPMNQNDYQSWLAISPEARDIINGNGNGQNGPSSPNCTAHGSCP
jgi:hypothetical protein